MRPPDAGPLRPGDVRDGQPGRGQPHRTGSTRALIYPDEIKRLAPAMQVDNPHATYPIMGALYHPPGGIIRHDAVVWGLARGADRGGVEIHQNTEVPGMERSNGRVTRGPDQPGHDQRRPVLNCTAGWSTLICDMADVQLPITTHILQACVTEPVKPLLDVVIVSSQMHVYISQTDRGEFLMGAEIEPWTTYRMQGTLNFLQEVTPPHAGAVPAAGAGAAAAQLGRAVRPQPRLQPDPRQDRGRELPRQRRLGHLRLQGRADRRQDARRAGRDRPHAGADRAVRARAVLRGQARLRACRGRREPLMQRAHQERRDTP